MAEMPHHKIKEPGPGLFYFVVWGKGEGFAWGVQLPIENTRLTFACKIRYRVLPLFYKGRCYRKGAVKMASIDCRKMTAASCGGMKVHLDDKERMSAHHSNEHINPELSHLNAWIGCRDYGEMLSNSQNNVDAADAIHPPRRVKKDRVTNVSYWIVCPDELAKSGRSKEFFEFAYEFISKYNEDTYGTSLPCGMTIHRDEVHEYADRGNVKRTSLEHAHMWCTPYARWTDKQTVYAADGKPKRDEHNKIVKKDCAAEGVNAKHFLTKSYLKNLQTEFDLALYEEYGIHYMTGQAPNHMTVEELKGESKRAAAIITRAEQEGKRLEQENESLKDTIKSNEFLAELSEGKWSEAYDRALEKQKEVETLEGTVEGLNARISHLNAQISHLTADYEKMHGQYTHNKAIIDNQEKTISQLQEKLDSFKAAFEKYISKATDILKDFWQGLNRVTLFDDLQDHQGADAELIKAHDTSIEQANTELVPAVAEPTREVIEEATQDFIQKRRRGR
jgi:molecular chaperone GrpE (heat shock protein)